MMNSPTSLPQVELDYEALPIEAIALSTDHIDRAVQLSHQIPDKLRKWQTYLHALALFGFEEWLERQAAEFNLNQEQSSVFQPAVANAIEAVCNLKVGEFKLCLIATGYPAEDEVILPRAIVDLPEFVPHFYVLVEVQEEEGSAIVSGFLPYNQLLSRRATVNLQADEDWTYEVPLTWFESDPERLLLYLRCLDESAIPLPAVPRDRLTALSRMQRELATLLPQLRSAGRQLWQVLTWEQGVAVLANPELLNLVYQVQSSREAGSELSSNVNIYISDFLQLLTQPAINVGRWLWNELDELAHSLSWMLLPNLAPSPMRSPVEEFEAIALQIQHRGLEIPPLARGACREVLLAGIPLRLYAVTWPLPPAPPDNQCWTLLLVLGVPSNMTLPYGIKFRVSDKTEVLAEQVLDPEQGDRYLYTCVIGAWEERFIVTVGLTNGIELTLPPFSFQPQPGTLQL